MDWNVFDGRWFAIRTHCRCEFTTEAALLSKGYRTYIPLPPSASVAAQRQRPLFPGYLFCRYDKRIRSHILGTHGVIKVVGLGDSPTPVEEWEIESIRTACGGFAPINTSTYLGGHPSVTIYGGPLNGVRGTFVKSQNRSMLVLSIHLLQRSVQIEFATCDVVLCNGIAVREFAAMNNRTVFCCTQTSGGCPENCHSEV
jgi:transcription antitermination factor NusG